MKKAGMPAVKNAAGSQLFCVKFIISIEDRSRASPKSKTRNLLLMILFHSTGPIRIQQRQQIIDLRLQLTPLICLSNLDA